MNHMTDATLARELAGKLAAYKWTSGVQTVEDFTALILAAFAQRDAARAGTLEDALNAKSPVPSEPASRAVLDQFSREAARRATTRPKCEPLSRAVPITAGTVVPFPCWLWDDLLLSWWKCRDADDMIRGRDTYYHPDQAHAPTIRPT